jgi:hypothetical protein
MLVTTFIAPCGVNDDSGDMPTGKVEVDLDMPAAAATPS